MNSTHLSLPTLLRVPEWGAQCGMTRSAAYAAVDRMPAGVKVKIGGRIRLNAERLAEYLQAGGDFANRTA